MLINLFFIFNCIVLIFVSFEVFAKDEMPGEETMHPLSLLPTEISGWSPERDDEIYTRDNLFDYMNGAGEIYLAYNFSQLFVREYNKKSAPPIIVEIYQMSTSEDAYGIFTQDTDGDEVAIGQEAIYAKGLLRFWKGKIFTRILASKETNKTKSVVLEIGRMIAESINQESKKPILVDFIPSQGLLPKSIRYFHKLVSLNSHYYISDSNILDLDENTEVILARYQNGKDKVRLLLIGYWDPEQAKAAYIQFVQIYLKDNPVTNSEIQITKTENGEFVSARKLNRFVILIFEADNQTTCKWLNKAIVEKLEKAFK